VTPRNRKKYAVPAVRPSISVFAWRVGGAFGQVFGSVEYRHSYEALPANR